MKEGCALVCAASKRVLGLDPFDTQILAGIAIYEGKLVEMGTGEGKTLAAVFAAYLRALEGKGVHVLTFNDYLARRDAGWMGPVFRLLGLTAGCVQQDTEPRRRKQEYLRDVTYLTAKEAGFDFLRDQLCLEAEEQVHRPFHFAIVDEADSILIDEARVPLVIAGDLPDQDEIPPQRWTDIASQLKSGIHFETDEYSRNAYLTDAGFDFVESRLNQGSLHEQESHGLLTALNLALHARVLLRRDVDYIVRDGKIELVDEFTGRVVENRRWPEGLQRAIEAKEGLPVRSASTIRGSIALQHFLRLYPRISGMTATARPAAEEFKAFYDLDVVAIPPHRNCIRIDHPDLVFPHEEGKWAALVEEIRRVRATGRPILVGTRSVEESEKLEARLREAGISCRLLNAKNDEQEAKIVAKAGEFGAVTISTNMAGRGTDIRLGGEDGRDHGRIAELGGLYVIGTNRHESLRIDDQLRGRAGRQGDPGSSRFFVSLEDDLVQRYGIRTLITSRYRDRKRDEPVEDPAVVEEIARSQRILEGQNFTIRLTLWKYSTIVEKQRQILHQRRQDVLADRLVPDLLEREAASRYLELLPVVGKEVLRKVEKRLTLHEIDELWAKHLAQAMDVREAIHWRSFGGFSPADDFQWLSPGGKSPLEEFRESVSQLFYELRGRIDEAVVETFLSARISRSGLDREAERLLRPSCTWTYQISDNPFGSWVERAIRGIQGKILSGKPGEG